MRYLNIGAGTYWKEENWQIADHKKFLFGSSSAWRTPYPDNHFDLVFTSHMFEHIPHIKIDHVFREINRILKKGGGIRILCPDLELIAKAYVEKDFNAFKKFTSEDVNIRQDLGIGGMFMNFIVSSGTDSILISRDGTCIGGYGHLYAYDFKMIKILLEKHGFGEINRCKFLESRYEVFNEPLHPIGQEAKWGEIQYKNIGKGLTGFDRDPITSLIVEAVKMNQSNVKYFHFGIRESLANTAFSPNIKGTESIINRIYRQSLNSNNFGWLKITKAYLYFSYCKILNTPQMLMVSFKYFILLILPLAWKNYLKCQIKKLRNENNCTIDDSGHRD